MKRRVLALLALFLGLAGAASATAAVPPATRFSLTLGEPERVSLGFTRLSSDQIAVLDALVRRDVAGRAMRAEDAPDKFSARLTDDERRNAGLGILNAEETARLDALVDRYTAAGLVRSLLAPPVYASRVRIAEPREEKAERKIHGSFSLSLGWGSGGYSERTGSMNLRMDDPAGRYSIQVGYSESHIKNGSYYPADLALSRPTPTAP